MADTVGDNLNHAESELARATETVHALRDARSHVCVGQVALRQDLPAGSWATMAAQAVDLAIAVLDQQIRSAVADKLAVERAVVAAHDAVRREAQ